MSYDHAFAQSSRTFRAGGKVGRPRVRRPSRDKHGIALSESEASAVRRALGGLTAGSFVRRAVLLAAGLPATALRTGPAPRGRALRKPEFVLRPEERDAVERALLGRDLTAWVRDAVRTAAGMRNNRFSSCANALIRAGFRRVDLAVMLRALPGRTSETVYAQALRLGVDTRLSDERTTIHGAVQLSGVTDRALRKLLGREGVPVATMVGYKRDATKRCRIVRRDDVARAVTADSRRETVTTAAARLGRARAALADAVERLGHARPAKRHRWRLDPEVFDAAARTMRGKGAAR